MAGLTILVLLWVASGCGSGEKSLVGNWDGSITPSDAAVKVGVEQARKAGQKATPEMVRSVIASLQLTLELKADKTFTMSAVESSTAGTWSASNGAVTLKRETVAGMSIEEVAKRAKGVAGIDKLAEPITGSLSKDGKTLTLNDPTQLGSPYTFTKKAG